MALAARAQGWGTGSRSWWLECGANRLPPVVRVDRQVVFGMSPTRAFAVAIVWQTPLGVESYLAAGRTGRDSWSRTRGRERASGEVQHQASHCGGAGPYRAEEFGPSSPALHG